MGNLCGILKRRTMDQTPASQNVTCKRPNKESIHTVMYLLSWLIITGSGLDDWIYWCLLSQSLLITINYKSSQSMSKTRSLEYDHFLFFLVFLLQWLTSFWFTNHFWFMNKLWITNEEWRTMDESNEEWICSSLHGCLYSLVVCKENVCLFVSTETFVGCSFTQKPL
jgi:hypothetical protein